MRRHVVVVAGVVSEAACTRCGQIRPAQDFKSSGYIRKRDSVAMPFSYCKSCEFTKRRTWATENPDKVVEYNKRRREKPKDPDKAKAAVLRRFNLSLTEYRYLAAQQGGRCVVCDVVPDVLVVDHNHGCCDFDGSCGLCIRGLLCHTCNRALGMLRDCPDLLLRAHDYVRDGGTALEDLLARGGTTD